MLLAQRMGNFRTQILENADRSRHEAEQQCRERQGQAEVWDALASLVEQRRQSEEQLRLLREKLAKVAAEVESQAADILGETMRALVLKKDADLAAGRKSLEAADQEFQLLQQEEASLAGHAILMISETLDRGSQLKFEDALRAVTETNTVIYSIGFSTGKSEAAHYAARELPIGAGLQNHHPNPPHGCMGKDPDPDPDATHNKAVQAYDCLTQLVPPLAFAKMAAIAATDGLKRNIPETVAHLTGGEYLKLADPANLERDLATISNHVPNRYALSYRPQSPHPGYHSIELRLNEYPKLQVTARSGYWADNDTALAPHP